MRESNLLQIVSGHNPTILINLKRPGSALGRVSTVNGHSRLADRGRDGPAPLGPPLDFVHRLGLGDSRLRRLIAIGVRRQLGSGRIRDYLAKVRPDAFLCREEVASLQMPILLIWGADDRILPRSALEFYRDNLPAHAVIEEPQCWGHSPYINDLDGFVTSVMAFIEKSAEAGD